MTEISDFLDTFSAPNIYKCMHGEKYHIAIFNINYIGHHVSYVCSRKKVFTALLTRKEQHWWQTVRLTFLFIDCLN